ncbi:MAG TPA: TetR/AcrR family transcriptional regulator [Microthrixaceae bacterium]|jgi:AcrR family transcriptional regulator|nr:TetR/AcrR family transcriptional regulator [Microthrixaceae bacterium]
MSRRLTQRGKERRAQIIEYATHRFATDGYHPTSVADIVDGLGVGKGVFYWYFESKEELFVEILRTAQRDMRRRQQRAIADVADPVQRIELGIRAAVEWMAEHNDLRRLFEFARTEAAFIPSMQAGQSVLVADAVVHLKEAIVEGRIPDRDPEALALAILGVANQLTNVYIDGRGEDPHHVADLVVDFCMEGLGVRS